MIRPLRRRHLWLIGAVAVITAPLYLAALAARPAPAVQEALPPGLSGPEPAADDDLGTAQTRDRAAREAPEVELPTTPPIRVRSATAGRVEITADGAIEGADLLLYWTDADGSRDLADAYLLGALRGGERQVLELPATAADAPGVLVLYSLGHGEEVAYAPWPAATEGRP